MDRVNGTDWVDIGGGRRGFRSQNAAAGVSGTEVTDKILNDIQEEICAVIEKAGFDLDPENQQQLWEALLQIAAPGFANRSPWMPIVSMTVTSPPVNPQLGDAYVIPANATGDWAGHSQKIAEWSGAVWRIFTPKNGHGVGLPDGRVFQRIGGVYTEWLASRDWVGGYATVIEAIAGILQNRIISPYTLAAVLKDRFGDNQERISTSTNPVFPEVLNATGKLAVSVSGLSVSVSAGQSWMHRGVYRYSSDDYSSAQRTFSVANNKEYHLRWTPSNGFVLKDLSDVTYNPTAMPSYNAAFDTVYDDMLCASVSVTGGIATVTSLVNKAELRGRATLSGLGTVLTTGNGNDGIRYRALWTLQWSRIPFYGVSGSTANTGGVELHGYANQIEILAATRHVVEAQVTSDYNGVIDGTASGILYMSAFA